MAQTKALLKAMLLGTAITAAGAALAGHHGDAKHAEVKHAQKIKAPKASAYIISPADGETVGQTFTVKFGLQGMGVAPAGVVREGTGHHHLLIDVDELPALNKPLPSTDQVRHFGGGQTETTLKLKPGKHTLQLILGDHMHVPHKPVIKSKKITVYVK